MDIQALIIMPFLLLNLLFSTLVLGLAALSAGEEDEFVFSGFKGANISIDGVATVSPDGLLDLTDAHERLKGHAFYPAPLRFHESPNGTVKSFSVSFVLAIYPNHRPSNGMAFFIAKSMDFSSALPVQYLGVFNAVNQGNSSNHIFAVEFDTVVNMDLRDIDANHVGININSIISNKSSTAGFYDDRAGGSFSALNLTGAEGLQVWVDYERESARINVTMSPLSVAAKPARPLISAIYDLSTVITEEAYLGFGSAAGKVDGSRHYILGWSFGMNKPAPAIDMSRLPRLPRFGPKPRSKLLEIVLPVATAAFVLTVGIAIFLLVRRHRRYAELTEDWEVEFGPHRFAYKDLYCATQGFKDKNLLGVGGFGRVYKGVLPRSKLEIAVKRSASHESKQGMKEFIAEVVSIGRLQHCNLVQLLGYCRRRGQLFLVYDYMPNGSLDKSLYHQEKNKLQPTINWAQRFQIIRGVASGLLYLHEEWEKIIIHRDVKASNVLLDGEMNARLGDFGLARSYDHGIDPQSTNVVGTIGYLAPELACSGKVTPLTDVFAFGIFILEVVCGQRPIEQDTNEKQPMLVDRVLEHWHNGSLIQMVDIKLHGDYDVDEAHLTLQLGLLCAHPFMDSRPTMRQVMQYLDGDRTTPELSPGHTNFEMLATMQNEGFDSYIVACPSSLESHGASSIVSGGR